MTPKLELNDKLQVKEKEEDTREGNSICKDSLVRKIIACFGNQKGTGVLPWEGWKR